MKRGITVGCSNSSLGYIHPEGCKVGAFLEASPIGAETWKQAKWALTDKQINKMGHIQTVE